jgi:hypothetical protein
VAKQLKAMSGSAAAMVGTRVMGAAPTLVSSSSVGMNTSASATSTFEGTDARIWVDKCVAYFALYQIPPNFRVSAASIHMIGDAAHWFQTYKLTLEFQNWE